MRTPPDRTRPRPFASMVALVAVVLLASGCRAGEPTAVPDEVDTQEAPSTTGALDRTAHEGSRGAEPPVVVASLADPSSQVVAEIVAQQLERAGHTIERRLDVGSRELLHQGLVDGDLDVALDHLGAALATGFGVEPSQDLDAGVEALQEAFAPQGVTVLAPAPAEQAPVMVTTAALADQHGLTTLQDLETLEEVTLAAPRACEPRPSCLRGLTDRYGLDIAFEPVDDPDERLRLLATGDAQVALAASTDARLGDDAYRVLDDPEGIVPPQNLVPVVRTSLLERAGAQLVDTIAEVSQRLTTDDLIAFDRLGRDGVPADRIARDFGDDVDGCVRQCDRSSSDAPS